MLPRALWTCHELRLFYAEVGSAQSNLTGFLSHLQKAEPGKCLETLTPQIKAEPSGHHSTLTGLSDEKHISEYSSASLILRQCMSLMLPSKTVQRHTSVQH